MRIEPFEPCARHPIRAPHEHALRLDAAVRHDWSWLNGGLAQGLTEAKDDPERYRHAATAVPSCLQEAPLALHARGDPIDELARRAVEAIDCTETIAREFPGQLLIAEPARRQDLDALAMCLLTLPDARTLARLVALTGKGGGGAVPVVDRLLEAFLPNRPSMAGPLCAREAAEARGGVGRAFRARPRRRGS